MTGSEVLAQALLLMQANADLSITQALALASPNDDAAWTEAVSMLLTNAGITPAPLGPDMIEQLREWEKAQKGAVIVAPMQAATATLQAAEATATQTAKPVTP